jgi:hemerythrin
LDTMSELLVSWRDEYCLRIESVDRQHQMLVAITRQLQEAMLEGRAREVQKELVEKLIDYTKYHFECEERLMTECGYEGLTNHQQSHRKLTGQVVDLQQQVTRRRAISSSQMLCFLRHWITDHILQADREFGVAYLTHQGGDPLRERS